jgi:hypothetical protein
MVSFLALYRGSALSDAELVAVSTDPTLISEVAGTLLKERPVDDFPVDPIRAAIVKGKKTALRLVKREADAQGEYDEVR